MAGRKTGLDSNDERAHVQQLLSAWGERLQITIRHLGTKDGKELHEAIRLLWLLFCVGVLNLCFWKSSHVLRFMSMPAEAWRVNLPVSSIDITMSRWKPMLCDQMYWTGYMGFMRFSICFALIYCLDIQNIAQEYRSATVMLAPLSPMLAKLFLRAASDTGCSTIQDNSIFYLLSLQTGCLGCVNNYQ